MTADGGRRRTGRRLGGVSGADAEIREELEHHLRTRVEENLARGLPPEEARAEALRRFGDPDRWRRRTAAVERAALRRARWSSWTGAARAEAGRAMAAAARSPAFSGIVVLTLALALGATAALFAVLDSVALRPLAYADADRLVSVGHPVPGLAPDAVWDLSEAGYFQYLDNARSLEDLGVYLSTPLVVTGRGDAERVRGAAVSASLLDVLGARPVAGRLLGDEDNAPGTPWVAVLGHGYWVRRFGGDPGVVGSTLTVSGNVVEIVGVAPPGLHLPRQEVDLWMPLHLDRSAPPVNSHFLTAVGRLAPAASVEAAEAELQALTDRFTELFPGAYSPTFMRDFGFRTAVRPLKDAVVGDFGRILWILLGSLGLLLLVAAANVANLFLARAESRRRDRALRAALGAGRGRLLGEALAFSMGLALAAGLLGVALAEGGLRLLAALSPPGIPRLSEVTLGWRTLAFAGALSVGAGLVFGLLSGAARSGGLAALGEGRGLTPSRARSRARRGLVVAQLAAALVLLASSTLLVRSFRNLRAVDPGLDARDVLTLEVALPAARYPGWTDVAAFWRSFLERVEGLPGVVGAGAATRLPLSGERGCASMFVEDHAPPPEETAPCVDHILAAPGFFETLAVPVRGRVPNWRDLAEGSGEVVVTRALADRFWPGQDPLGKGIRGNGWAPPFYRVVGVAEGLRLEGLDRPPTEAVFFPLLPVEGAPLWIPPRTMTVVLRSGTRTPEALAASVRGLLGELDPEVPLANVRTMARVVEASMMRVTFTTLLLGVAAGMALLLGVVGVYGLIAYTVERRRGEIGIRMALGARATEVAGLVVRQSVGLAMLGVAVGVPLALALARGLGALLFGVSPTDPATLASVAAALLGIATAAAFLPAVRAARVDPARALRSE